jgi:hypothetical protein
MIYDILQKSVKGGMSPAFFSEVIPGLSSVCTKTISRDYKTSAKVRAALFKLWQLALSHYMPPLITSTVSEMTAKNPLATIFRDNKTKNEKQ